MSKYRGQVSGKSDKADRDMRVIQYNKQIDDQSRVSAVSEYYTSRITIKPTTDPLMSVHIKSSALFLNYLQYQLNIPKHVSAHTCKACMRLQQWLRNNILTDPPFPPATRLSTTAHSDILLQWPSCSECTPLHVQEATKRYEYYQTLHQRAPVV
jgi:hypothetical protein